MTTKVVVAAPAPGHLAVKVQQQEFRQSVEGSPAGWYDHDQAERIEPGGCSKEHYVYAGRRLVIEEIPAGS